MIAIIDNYDSFTYNLVQALGHLGADLEVFRNDAIDAAALSRRQPAGVVLSPGPGRPESAGCCIEVVRSLGDRVPMLGVCLGHQAMAVAHGARVVRAGEVVHGKTAVVRHEGQGIFAGLPQEFEAARYHSLVVDPESLLPAWRIDATEPGGLVMAISHRQLPLYGVQFHPESIATPEGPRLLANFLERAESGR